MIQCPLEKGHFINIHVMFNVFCILSRMCLLDNPVDSTDCGGLVLVGIDLEAVLEQKGNLSGEDVDHFFTAN